METGEHKVSRWKEDIQSVFDRDPAARNTFEIITTYPGVHAIVFHRLAHALWGFGLRVGDYPQSRTKY
ncbi:MAG: hypothetical protein DBP01_02045 [gamma proteobacterium symbiont of Ctena orbiculata]|nr:MAG: hypothetical protein DBP01_02045 [gamma proteobacterium symbiont of Ctena orbiculata]